MELARDAVAASPYLVQFERARYCRHTRTIPARKGAKRLFGPAGDPARLPQGEPSIGREPAKRAMGDSVVASDEASYVTGSIFLVAGQFRK